MYGLKPVPFSRIRLLEWLNQLPGQAFEKAHGHTARRRRATGAGTDAGANCSSGAGFATAARRAGWRLAGLRDSGRPLSPRLVGLAWRRWSDSGDPDHCPSLARRSAAQSECAGHRDAQQGAGRARAQGQTGGRRNGPSSKARPKRNRTSRSPSRTIWPGSANRAARRCRGRRWRKAAAMGR